MRLINLDQFKKSTMVTLDGIEYEVMEMSVEDFINSPFDTMIQKATTIEDKVDVIISHLKSYTAMPEEVMRRQGFGVLNALITITQGGTPEADPKEQSTGKK